MEYDKEQRPKVGLAVYIINDKNQLLLLHRKSSHGPGTWCPPGGHQEYQESFLECAKRETKEESDLDVEDVEVLGVTNDIYYDENKHYITIATKALKVSGEPKNMELEKCGEMQWFDLDKLPRPLFLPVRNFFADNPLCLCGSSKKFFSCHGSNFKAEPPLSAA